MEVGDSEHREQTRTPRVFFLGCATVLLWFVVLTLAHPTPIADESRHHLSVIGRFASGDWSLPSHLPMLPAYHAAAAMVAKLTGRHFVALRGFTVLLTFLTLWVTARIVAATTSSNHQNGLLHVAWNPILFPFTALVYVDVAGLLPLVAAFYFHVREQFGRSALCLLFACLIHQSSIVWVVFLGAWFLHDSYLQRRLTWGRLNKLLGHGLLLTAAAVAFLCLGRLTVAPVQANVVRLNVAQGYSFGLFTMILWAPIWLVRLGGELKQWLTWATHHKGKALVMVAAVLAMSIGLVLLFENPHPWNRGRGFVRNWPLIAMSRSWQARIGVVGLMALSIPVLFRFFLAQPRRRALGWLGICSLFFLACHSLVDPRYYIVPFVFAGLLVDLPSAEARRVSAWYFALCVAISTYVCAYGSPNGGIW